MDGRRRRRRKKRRRGRSEEGELLGAGPHSFNETVAYGRPSTMTNHRSRCDNARLHPSTPARSRDSLRSSGARLENIPRAVWTASSSEMREEIVGARSMDPTGTSRAGESTVRANRLIRNNSRFK